MSISKQRCIVQGIRFVRVIISETLSGFHFKVKILSLSSLFNLTCLLSHCFEGTIEKMAKNSTSTVKFMSPHPLKIDMVKFDGKNNFDM